MRPVTRPRPPTLQPVGMSTGEDLRKYWDNLQKKQEALKQKCEKTGKDYLTELQRLRTAQEEKLIQDEYKLDCKTRDSIIAGNIKGASHRTEPPQSLAASPTPTPLSIGFVRMRAVVVWSSSYSPPTPRPAGPPFHLPLLCVQAKT